MARNHKDWIQAFIEYASYGEAPAHMHFWTAVSVIAGALKRKVWIDQVYFKWYANFYIILVAPPGIVSKSTTAGIGMDLLRQVPDIKFGPSVVTWQAMLSAFEDATDAFETGPGEYLTQSALTFEASEFGNLLNPQDKEMIDLLVALWDGKEGAFEKKTKHSGNDSVVNPWVNIIACTTPSWIAGNFPEYMIGGGFCSRCLFVYAEEKKRYVAYLASVVPKDIKDRAMTLVQDLEHIAMSLKGEMKLSPEAIEWGEKWYEEHYGNKNHRLDSDRFGGYLARKQTHIHKLAMILSVSRGDDMIITKEDLETANVMVTDLEQDMPKVFNKLGMSDVAYHTERLINKIYASGPQGMMVQDAYRFVHANFPSAKEFEDVVQGAIRAGILRMEQVGMHFYLRPVERREHEREE
jgi:hypothetical protein